MESRVPLPTDNIYKFYALFGLLLLIFSIGGVIAVQRSTNDFMYRSLIDLEAVKAVEKPSAADAVKKALLEQLIEVGKQDKKFFDNALGVLAAIGVASMAFGFQRWHSKVQPLQDDLLRLQVEKLNRELNPPAPATASRTEQPQVDAGLPVRAGRRS